MTKLLNAKQVSDNLVNILADRSRILRENGILPRLAVLRAGNDPAAISYERSIVNLMSVSSVETDRYVFDDNVSLREILSKIEEKNNDSMIHGILFLTPAPKNIDINIIKQAIRWEKDVDCMNPVNLGKLVMGDDTGFLPCTAQGIIRLLEYYEIDVTGKSVLIINKSPVVGKPLSLMLADKYATVTVATRHTADLPRYVYSSDIVITAVGQYGFITADMINENSVIIDAAVTGYADENDKWVRCGDVHTDCISKPRSITSLTGNAGGGTGILTTAMLCSNVMKAAEAQSGKYYGEQI